MTATVAAPSWLRPHERFRRIGGELITARITAGGLVLIHRLVVTARPAERGTVELWPTVTETTTLGRVDPDDPNAWFTAEVLVRRAGYTPCEDWTTVDRMPAARLRRAPWFSPGTVPGGE